MKQILVTGGTGYIGSHTVVELQKKGYDVVIVDDLSNSEKNVLDRIEKISGVKPHFEEFNLVDPLKTNQLFEKYPKIEAIIHFAAFKAVGESVQKPLAYYQNNLVSLINLLNAMKEYKVPHMVFSSSCTVYGQPEKLPVTENAPVQPAESPYGNTKQICEEILRDTAKAYPELNTIALRYFNPVGAHETALIGELPKGVPQNLVPFITQTAIGLRDQLSVFGDDYNTIDGSAVRDYIHVVDLAQAHIIAAERLLDANNEENFEFFNLGTGTGSSVLQVINAFEEANGIPVKYKIVDRREGDVEQIWADTTIANEVLGWKASKGLNEMMSSAWAWEKNIREGDC
ncbi:UDP-glucose 4-epimerase GalE [Flammeovirga yaeyamensis]|uniref:UDP-glucose 4-epimerase n=1 Tax=Flammeovirga yaeyamensis TaxID=367791 RepID=A0AAX1MZX1_9BACT|nr:MULTISPECIES: UDP-glucose 4-epimerase GalE [Flammeovirga]ANQ47729.1 UDP-glucose 4-epimerase GalE [Flammeovirga sp. MY04]MBB3700192.1 UDP-glucose 4-epimerase [Flammeovirga yaeyamensis]NMF37178.1 UDP-glucose 4-epimerase GalE [Flammeovirga yaeyamensis]QWG00868.1 UDP-glucose 4-epimerase GalE [Flammeovirga yaeyamensis]